VLRTDGDLSFCTFNRSREQLTPHLGKPKEITRCVVGHLERRVLADRAELDLATIAAPKGTGVSGVDQGVDNGRAG